ncbi:islet cell autoantigen 1-like isoform X2 [Clavelina lepadiformis]|uniref:islet cell autoantigen 1-like isoform X2 n=1 Tax=Clavelina lepadiformis TaxID=159417 RepID=UPI0040422587
MSYSKYDSAGYSGQSYDRNVFEANLSTVNKLQRDYWNAKQVLRKKFGKEDDQHVVASDSELDSKLDLFHSVQKTSSDLIKTIEKYQECVCMLSRDENAMGRFLKEQGALDKTSAGKMMIAVGKAQCYTSQQRLNLRHSLSRMRLDVETFRYRAIGDSVLSVDQMEDSRTHYRASLLWMQDISSKLDPEQYKKLEKFRKVQTEVRLNKEKFDRQKWAVCQKVDLLCASRSNLFSNTLVPYQNEILKFWEKTAHTMAAVLENIKDYQNYEFKLLKGLNPMQELDSLKQGEGGEVEKKSAEEDVDDEQLINLNDDLAEESLSIEKAIQELDLMDESKDKEGVAKSNEPDNILLGGFNETSPQEPSKEDLDLLNDILGEEVGTGADDLKEQWQSVFGDFIQAPAAEETKPTEPEQSLGDDLLKDLSSPPPSVSGYLPSQLLDLMATEQSPNMPNQLNLNVPQQPMGLSNPPVMGMGQMMGYQPPTYQSMFGGPTPSQQAAQDKSAPKPMQVPSRKADGKGGMSAWYNLFAELDPLQNPDALGKKKDEKSKDGGAC